MRGSRGKGKEGERLGDGEGEGKGKGKGEGEKEVQYLQRGGEGRSMPEGSSDQGGGGRGVYFAVSSLFCYSQRRSFAANQSNRKEERSKE